MVAKPAPLIMSAQTYCSSLSEAFIPVHLPQCRQLSPALPGRGSILLRRPLSA
jgi:hypothetical protein